MVQISQAPVKTPISSLAISQPISFAGNSSTSSGRSSLSSSRLEFGSISSEIVRRNLVTDFLSATSLPVNVPIHRSLEAEKPNTPMREEFDRCIRQLPFSLASKLFSVPSLSEEEEDRQWEEDVADRRGSIDSTKKKKISNNELVFKMEI